MSTLKDRLWLWGQSPDAHYEHNNTYNLPGHSRMSAVEGCYYFDIHNICRVRMMGHPQPPYDQESIAMRPCRQVVWSLLGAGGEPVTEWGDAEEVIRQAKMFPNITGGVFDDFFLKKRLETYTPDRLHTLGERLDREAGRHLDMWVVCYEHNLDDVPNIAEYLNEFDVISFWTWRGSELCRAERNIERVRALAPTKRIMAGMYMWNYGERRPLTDEEMSGQAATYLRLIEEGKLDGIILCSNCIGDLGIDAVEWTRNWIAEHKNDPVPER